MKATVPWEVVWGALAPLYPDVVPGQPGGRQACARYLATVLTDKRHGADSWGRTLERWSSGVAISLEDADDVLCAHGIVLSTIWADYHQLPMTEEVIPEGQHYVEQALARRDRVTQEVGRK
jgi:hypothetical protein